VPISHTEPTELICPACGNPFVAEIWTLVDVGEQPDLYDALLSGSLHLAICPHCGHSSSADSPLLLHDPGLRRVYFAVPGQADEHVWREHAQTLLYELVGSLPDEARLPYLGDVQISQGLDGLRHSLLRRGRRGKQDATRGRGTPQPVATIPTNPLASSPLLDLVQVLLAADSPAEFQEIVRSHPDLLSAAADGLLEALAAEAKRAAEPDAVRAIQKVRATLQGMRDGAPTPVPGQEAVQPTADALPEDLSVLEPPAIGAFLASAAYQSFLAATSPEDFVDAARGHPVLLEPETNAAIALWAEEALDTGNERLAALIDQQREALAGVQQQLTNEPALHEAIGVLLAAESEEALAQALSEHPALLTTAAQQALATMAAEARAGDDEPLAIHAIECSAMLREVRRGLEAIE
jgi:hypothetical protein